MDNYKWFESLETLRCCALLLILRLLDSLYRRVCPDAQVGVMPHLTSNYSLHFHTYPTNHKFNWSCYWRNRIASTRTKNPIYINSYKTWCWAHDICSKASSQKLTPHVINQQTFTPAQEYELTLYISRQRKRGAPSLRDVVQSWGKSKSLVGVKFLRRHKNDLVLKATTYNRYQADPEGKHELYLRSGIQK